MNFYKNKLKEKKEYLHKLPEDKTSQLKKVKMDKMKNPSKNAKLGMF